MIMKMNLILFLPLILTLLTLLLTVLLTMLAKKVNFKILTLILLLSLHNFTCNKPNNKILVNFINLLIDKAYNQTYFLLVNNLKETK